MTERPEKPQYMTVDTTDSAHAYTMKQMTSKDNIAILANIRESWLHSIAILKSVGDDFKIKTISEYADTFLALTCAINGKRSDQITMIEKQPALMTPETQSLLDRIRGRFKR